MEAAGGLHARLAEALGPEVAQYAVPFAYRIRFCVQLNAREAFHLLHYVQQAARFHADPGCLEELLAVSDRVERGRPGTKGPDPRVREREAAAEFLVPHRPGVGQRFESERLRASEVGDHRGADRSAPSRGLLQHRHDATPVLRGEPLHGIDRTQHL